MQMVSAKKETAIDIRRIDVAMEIIFIRCARMLQMFVAKNNMEILRAPFFCRVSFTQFDLFESSKNIVGAE